MIRKFDLLARLTEVERQIAPTSRRTAAPDRALSEIVADNVEHTADRIIAIEQRIEQIERHLVDAAATYLRSIENRSPTQGDVSKYPYEVAQVSFDGLTWENGRVDDLKYSQGTSKPAFSRTIEVVGGSFAKFGTEQPGISLGKIFSYDFSPKTITNEQFLRGVSYTGSAYYESHDPAKVTFEFTITRLQLDEWVSRINAFFTGG